MKGRAGTRRPLSPSCYLPNPQSLSTSASGFLFLTNKQKITICNWAGGVWEGGPLSVGDGDGGLWKEGWGKGSNLEKKKTGLRAQSRGKTAGFRGGLCGALTGISPSGPQLARHQDEMSQGSSSRTWLTVATSPASLLDRRQAAVNLFHGQFTPF